MIKDLLVSFTDNIKQKTSNPFLGTLILVWIVHNFENLYKIIFSGNHYVFDEKLTFLKNLLNPKNFLINLLECIGIAVIVLITTYFLLNLSRLIVNFYEKIITPWIYKITDKSSIVLKSNYDILYSEKERMLKKLESEKEEKLKLESEIALLENKIKSFNEKESISKDEITIENDKLVKLLKEKGYLEDFERLIYNINSDVWVDLDDSIRYFVTSGLIESISTRSGGIRKYKFTDKGLEFQEYYRGNYLK